MTIAENLLAPDFELLDEQEQKHRLSDYRNKAVILYFYPKDDTPGCTAEACEFRNDYSVYNEKGIVILGISPDSPGSHAKFKTKHGLPFTLLSDDNHRVCEQYGVWGKKKYMGREYDGVFRTTFLIGPDGMILKVFEDVKPQGHSKLVLEALEASGY